MRHREGRALSATEPDLARVWQGTVSTLGDAGLTAQQRAFLRLARLVGLIDTTALVAVPNEYTKDVLEQRLRAQVIDALGAQLECEVLLAVTVDPSLAGDTALGDATLGVASVEPEPAENTAGEEAVVDLTDGARLGGETGSGLDGRSDLGDPDQESRPAAMV